jgi:hypothetical protein
MKKPLSSMSHRMTTRNGMNKNGVSDTTLTRSAEMFAPEKG